MKDDPPPPLLPHRRIWTSNVPSAERIVPFILPAKKNGGSWYTSVQGLLLPQLALRRRYKEEGGRGQMMRRRGPEDRRTIFLKVGCVIGGALGALCLHRIPAETPTAVNLAHLADPCQCASSEMPIVSRAYMKSCAICSAIVDNVLVRLGANSLCKML